jgi:hypothetical protein
MITTINSWLAEKETKCFDDVWNDEITKLFDAYEEVFEEIIQDEDHEMFEIIGDELLEYLIAYELLFNRCREYYEPSSFTDALNDPEIAEEILIPFMTFFISIVEPFCDCSSGKTHGHIVRDIGHFTLSAFFNCNSKICNVKL